MVFILSAADRICLADLLRTLLVPRLLLPPLVADDTLILCAGRWQLRFWHTFLAAVLAALILHTFKIIFLGHCDQTFPGELFHTWSTRLDAAGFHQ
jgi:hypothetical protein